MMKVTEVAAGIDIGGTNSVIGLVDRDGNLIAEETLKTANFGNYDRFVEALWSVTGALCSRTGKHIDLTGIGIGAPMGNINKGTIEYAASLPWPGIVPLADLFSVHTDLPVIVTNDANAAAVGEMIYGGAKKMKNFVVITLGTGLGSGFVVDGKLVYGHDGFAGELGHTSTGSGYTERECGCGKKGCLETYVSATGLKRTLLSLMAKSLEPSRLRNIPSDALDAKVIYDEAVAGDRLALMAFRITGNILGNTLADVAAHTNPEAFFLFGGLAKAGEIIFGPAKEAMEENLLFIYRGKIKLLESELSLQNAAVLGASSLVWAGIK